MNERLELVVRTMAATAIENEQYFSELDGVVGDGDFGYSLARGFEKVLEAWDDLDSSTPGPFLTKVASIIIGAVGGVSGTIWGTAFLRAGTSLGAKTEIDGPDVVALLRAAIEGIKKRGQSDVGDKTLLDALVPAVDALENALGEGKSGGGGSGRGGGSRARRRRGHAVRCSPREGGLRTQESGASVRSMPVRLRWPCSWKPSAKAWTE